ncbi:probable phosphorylase b kinase regulatory subunit alpha [Dermacentor albipictus]|uniref:probable phosphorylase b kinase regulatory subunit alpha n=1 Tax=Dermacentor albipictus TaxID=60249 RepID=UPI0031FE330B
MHQRERFRGRRLDYYHNLLYRTVIAHQDPVTGLVPGHKFFARHAWVRDNVYCVLSMWALSMAYKKRAELDDDRATAYELEHRSIKLMRGLLVAMMNQKDKVERFKETQSASDCLHAKYDAATGGTCVGDQDWGHLQIDATSLFLLVLAQLTAAGQQIIYNLDEVAFVQNLVFYIENAYCVPDYGVWERGDKTNQGIRELNASSVGAAKAALEAMSELDLFGCRGGPASVIHVLSDETQKCDAVLRSMLPRESNSKEVDAALLMVVGFPAFAVDDPDLIHRTRATVAEKLQGQYGCKRFLRDGYKTPREDCRRLYYEPWELQMFDNIECEWPLFFCYFIIDACFREDRNTVDEYSDLLDRVLIKTDDGLRLVPEMYAVPEDAVTREYNNPHTQARIPVGEIPFMWAQSLYVVAKLLEEGFLAPGELDPLNRRFKSLRRPELVVQLVLLAENDDVKEKIASIYPNIQTVDEAYPFEIHPARVLGELYSYLGQNRKMNFSGRLSKDVGLVATSKIYQLQDRTCVFMPQNLDIKEFHLVNDVDLFASTLRSDVAMLRADWNVPGRPTMVVTLGSRQLIEGKVPVSLRQTIKKLVGGYVHGTRVCLSPIGEFVSTSCVASLDFLASYEDGEPDTVPMPIRDYLDRETTRPALQGSSSKSSLLGQATSTLPHGGASAGTPSGGRRKSPASGLIRRSRSLTGQETPSGELMFAMAQSELPSQPNSLMISRRSSFDDAPVPFHAVSELQLEQVADSELLTTLQSTDSMEEQGDILHYLSMHKGFHWDTGLGHPNSVVTVWQLFQDFYERACLEHRWGLVRHFAGALGKRVEDLAKSVTDLLVRQKQVTVGMPPHHEKVITRPLSNKELRAIINEAHRGDQSMAMLTQELLAYLAMFIQTDPHLFHEMVRLRVGLIIQLMASELARAAGNKDADTAELLLNLSPYETQTLLLAILSGRELAGCRTLSAPDSAAASFKHSASFKQSAVQTFVHGPEILEGDLETPANHPHGHWLRRRRLDGALNRVPVGFYSRVWAILERCPGVWIRGQCLPWALIREMTPGEFKFALRVEEALNRIPEPEYRQLLVETLMVLSLAVEYETVEKFREPLDIEGIVQRAHGLFLEDQRQCKGDSTLCCCVSPPVVPCRATVGICERFYDSAPSGCYGTMTYLVRAVAYMLHDLTTLTDCTVC